MYGCESWIVKKADCLRMDALELWCWRRLLRVPWTARRSNQSILKEISPGCSLEGLMLKLKLQYFGHLMRSWLIGKDSDAGRDWGQEEKGTTEDETAGWYHRLNGHEFEWTPGVGDGQGGLACCNSWGRKESDMTEQLNWTEPLPNITQINIIHTANTLRIFLLLLYNHSFQLLLTTPYLPQPPISGTSDQFTVTIHSLVSSIILYKWKSIICTFLLLISFTQEIKINPHLCVKSSYLCIAD